MEDMDLFNDVWDEVWKGLSAWDIFWLVLDILFALTPAGWIKRGAQIMIVIGPLGHALYEKYEIFVEDPEPH